jgi:hypothetical protein
MVIKSGWHLVGLLSLLVCGVNGWADTTTRVPAGVELIENRAGHYPSGDASSRHRWRGLEGLQHYTAGVECVVQRYSDASAYDNRDERDHDLKGDAESLPDALSVQQVRLMSKLSQAQRMFVVEMLLLHLQELRLRC